MALSDIEKARRNPSVFNKSLRVLDGRDEQLISPCLGLSKICHSDFLAGSPDEILSEKIETDFPRILEKEPLQIEVDRFLGKYFPKKRRIEIYYRAIQRVSERIGVKFSDLFSVVRVHEWAHAIFHLGVPLYSQNTANSLPDDFPIQKDWRSFRRNRTTRFLKTDSVLHEKIAQGLTYKFARDRSLVSGDRDNKELLAAYLKLEEIQSPKYQLSGEEKDIASRIVSWVDVIDHENEAHPRAETIFFFPDEPIDCGAFSVDEHNGKDGSENLLEFQVHRIEKGSVSFVIHPNDHEPPHVHVRCPDQEASIRIDSGEILAGSIKGKLLKPATRWITKNRDELMEKWDGRNS